MFTCYYCKELKPDDLAKKGTITGINTGKCKKCHNSYVSNREIRRRVEKKPQDYFQCDDCDRYMNVFRNVNSIYKKREMITECKFCKSRNIDDVIQ